ncbi:trehalose-phosphatase [Pontibacter qinzhouensis]|uniref:Trehalose 6-phosphate phosphatase n=1 Tax=Pontibacter qinzhouensis TaxID=2603253 RepID=A0A5C8K5V5_9BACT|nr:trehalose-phosphatase [Pontibacter qinzhouensis]TXK46383.1 trehalose-phosphatase [Pontibacter qinzhouensis]
MITSGDKHITRKEAAELPSAFDKMEELREKLQGKKPAVFLDYDGCLSPIVKDPDKAILTDEMRQVLQQLAETCTVSVVSGRDRQNVKNLVQLESLYYAGSHGFDITGPNGMQAEPGDAHEALVALDTAEEELKERLTDVEGALVERKRYAIAVHYRNVEDALVDIVQKAVDDIVNAHDGLKKGFGKKVLELKPNLDWHKGKAVLWLMKELGLDLDTTVPIYIGDDITDEDAFAALQGIGISVLVGEHDEKTAAAYSLEDVDEVKQFLSDLSKL